MQSSIEQDIGVRELLEAGVHFGHQARRWNPKMKKYVFAERAGVHIIDLDQTLELLDRARRFAREVAEAGREILFVGTKKQAQYTVAEQAIRSSQPYVVERYIGGMLTNFQTIYPRIQYFKDLARDVEETPEEERTGREWYAREREYQKLRRNFAGITEMERLPGAVFVVDPKKEELLVKEANRLKIPVVALTDTNCDPDVVDYVVPGNDDAIRSINLVSGLIADAILEGRGDEGASLSDEMFAPPTVEEARIVEEVATAKSISEAAEEGGVSDDDTQGLADPEESAGEISPEEDPTTSYRGAFDRQERQRERVSGDAPSGPETGRDMTEKAEGVPGGGEMRPGEALRDDEGVPEEAAPGGAGFAEPGSGEPKTEGAAASGREAIKTEVEGNDETEEG
jgi:small subunit ribosomal protein S2